MIGFGDSDYRHSVRESKAVRADCVDYMLGIDGDPDSAVFSMRLNTVRALNWSDAGQETLLAIRALGEGRHYLDVRSAEGCRLPAWLALYVPPGVPFASPIGVEILPAEQDGQFRPPGSPVYRHHVKELARPPIHLDHAVPDDQMRLLREPGYRGPTVFANAETLAAIANAGSAMQVVNFAQELSDGIAPVPAPLLYGGSHATADLRRAIGYRAGRDAGEDNVCCVMPGCLQDATTEVNEGTGPFWLCTLHASMLASWVDLVDSEGSPHLG